MLFQRFGYGVAALQVVTYLDQHPAQKWLFRLLGEQAEDAQGRNLRLEERCYLPREEHQVARGYAAKKGDLLHLLQYRLLSPAGNRGDGKPFALERRDGRVLARGVDRAARGLACLVQCFVLKFRHS